MVFGRQITHGTIASRKKMGSRLRVTKPPSTIVPNSHVNERRAHADFASRYGEAQYRGPLRELHATWDGFNTDPERRQVG